MPRTIPIALASHIKGDATTLCLIVKITPTQPGFARFGITTLDADVVYDDGDGALTYLAAVGSEPSNLTSSADLSVSGGESKQLMPVYDTPASEAELTAGAYDYAEFVAYAVNYKNLTAGQHLILQTGTLGRNSITDEGLTWTTELRGLTQPLKQSITEKWSLTCRAVFGSTGTSAQSRYPCNFDISTLWSDGTVTAVGVDDTQLFHSNDVAVTYGGSPGAVEWLTGANAGRTDETEFFTQTGTFTGSGTFSGTGTFNSASAPSTTLTFTGTGDFTGDSGGIFSGTGTFTGAGGLTGTGTFSGTGSYAGGVFTGTGTWTGVSTLWGSAAGSGTYAGTGSGGDTLANVIGLTFGASYAIKVGDTFRFRDDCPKTPLACQARHNYQNYRGEPSIPVADNGAIGVGNIGGAVTTTTGE